MVRFCGLAGVPQIVPFVLPKISPFGSSGVISQLSGVDPEVCPDIGCIGMPSTSTSSVVGKERVMPFPMIHMETSVLVAPPELFAQTV